MLFGSEGKPKLVNTTHFSTEKFPELLGFCERDDKTHVVSGDEENYQYKLHDKKVYSIKKKSNKWEIIEFDLDNKIIRVSTGTKLGMVLVNALSFRGADGNKQDQRANILIPVNTEDREKAIALMYYLGGYPGDFLEETPEQKLITEKFISPNISFLSYPYVPVMYVPWLREEFKKAGITGQDSSRTIWIYRK